VAAGTTPFERKAEPTARRRAPNTEPPEQAMQEVPVGFLLAGDQLLEFQLGATRH
jgi:hypothetical protein